MSFGSCFAVNIGSKFDYFKFRNNCNPFGIVFHPAGINEIIGKIVSNAHFTDDDIFLHNDLWHCFDVHSDLSHPDKNLLLRRLNGNLESANENLNNATCLIITYGTAWVYRNKTSGKLVANCHKVRQSQFDKELLSAADIQKAIHQTIALIQKVNPNCQIIFTISPVRHVKDGFVENQRGKAHLIAAIHQLLSDLSSEIGIQPSYFPSYEIVMDELRDYRYYAEDMLHPNQTAIDYIWEKFAETYISDDAHATMQEVASIQKALRHKPFHPESESHRAFTAELQQRIAALEHRIPQIQF